MKKRVLALMTALVLAAVSLAACSSADDAKDKKETKEETKSEQTKLKDVTLNEVAHSIFYAPMYVAIEEGYFEEEGINLTLVTGFGENLIVQKEPGIVLGSFCILYTITGTISL